jgi:hypothetical protein
LSIIVSSVERHLQVAPPLRIMAREDIAGMAWIDLGAYNVLEEYQCLPAHARQDPQVSGWLTPRLCCLVDL